MLIKQFYIVLCSCNKCAEQKRKSEVEKCCTVKHKTKNSSSRLCVCLHRCCSFHAGFHSHFDKCFMKNEFFRAQTHVHTPIECSPTLVFLTRSPSSSLKYVLNTSTNIFICAFKLYIVSYILSLIYVLWLLLIACSYTLVPFRCDSSCSSSAFFFNSKTFSMVSGYCIYRSLLQCVWIQFYNRKSLYDATHFGLATHSIKLRFNIFSHLKTMGERCYKRMTTHAHTHRQ